METKVVIQKLKEEDSKIIKRHMYWSVVGGLVPIPLIDFAAVTAIQLDMISELCKNYKINFSKNSVKAIISALTGTATARFASSIVKAIPGIGTVAGAVSMPILSGASTYALGEVFASHFRAGGDLSNFKAENFKDYYKSKFEDGKTMAEEVKKKKKEKSKS